MRTLIFTVCLVLCVSDALAQKQNNIWHFGDNAGIDFNTDPPTAIRGFLNQVPEGTATICNPWTGELLFVTHGTYVLDRTGEMMPGSGGMIGGNGTSTQAATILPFARDSNKYYVITCDQGGYAGGNQGVFYSIVDMALRGGLGDVTTKNVMLFPPQMTEKLTAIPHANECDTWIIAHRRSNEYVAVLLSNDVISTEPVVSPLGHAPDYGSGQETIGWLVASRDGSQLAYVGYEGILELLDFDRNTGVVSNVRRIYEDSPGLYGACFSPSGRFLYAVDLAGLHQFDLAQPTDEIAGYSELLSPRAYAAIRPGPDGKLYYSSTDGFYIGVVNFPDELGAAAGVRDSAIRLQFGTRANYSMPNVLDALMERQLRPCIKPFLTFESSLNSACAGDCIEFTSVTSEPMTLEWVVSDGRRFAASSNTTICFTDTGTYTVELIGETGKGERVVATRTLTIKPVLGLGLRPFTIISDTIGEVFKIPIVLSDSVTSVYRGSFSFDPSKVEYLGAYDRDDIRIDEGSDPQNGRIIMTRRLIGDSVVGYLYVTNYGRDELCQDVIASSSSLSSGGVNCLGTTTYQVCLSDKCGNPTVARYMRNSTISLSLSPNPAQHSLSVVTSQKVEAATITIFDANGKLWQRTMRDIQAARPEQIDISTMPPGVYFLSVASSILNGRKSFTVTK